MASKKNQRVFYASHDVLLANTSNSPVEAEFTAYLAVVNGGVIQGAQSVGLDTNFGGADQLFQLGRLEAYDSTLTAPEVQMTISKSLDGWPLIWHHQAGALTKATLLDQVNAKSTARLTVANDTDTYVRENNIHADNTCNSVTNGNATVEMTGCYLTSFSYTFGDGVFTEEVTIQGASKSIVNTNNLAPKYAPLADDKYWISGSPGNVLSRQNFKQSDSVLPALIANEKISQITVSGDLASEPLFQLGSFYAVDRQSPLPVNITVQFDVIADTVDCVGVAIETVGECASPTGLTGKEPIYLEFCNSTGTAVYGFDFRAYENSQPKPTAKLDSVSYSGGDTGGGNVTITYTYIVANILDIQYYDPASIGS